MGSLTLDALTVHVVDSVSTTTADADHLDIRRLAFGGVKSEKRCLLD